ncbi:MAG TPA: CRISPR-associated endoribonuclease Cas6 [Defluviitoga sp.]|mgnify:CR=1 FL=1|nr:CRISPR-associated endoribonuclease Cas6 [Defluviitoga sp.]HOP23983.1 CRISPR-associated endoribonuclease Cas6 [Defluviitoga sp.]HPZ28918.1 CRISPR-associated endoribonuclease Cas6 [Defluviitoga sp.]HQD62304.1 CRISPR-associated endoribonuclease Cas6 [Defluviitoga sp.]
MIELVLSSIDGKEINLPVHYNRPLQGLFYSLMSESMPYYHDKGTKSDDKKLKLFTYSRIYPHNSFKVYNKRMKFEGLFSIFFASPMDELVQAVLNSLNEQKVLRIEKNYFTLVKYEKIENKVEDGELLVKTLSPITAYSTILLPNGSRYTHYFSPYSTDFKKLVEENLKRKAKALKLDTKNNSFSIEPYGITEKNEKLLFYKDIIIKGWTGYFILRGDPILIELALNSGLGAKNAQGFGMVFPANRKMKNREFSSNTNQKHKNEFIP